MKSDYLKAKLINLPHEPGSYQMKNKNDEIIYVGKAKDLHNRQFYIHDLLNLLRLLDHFLKYYQNFS